MDIKTRGKFWACLETFQPDFSVWVDVSKLGRTRESAWKKGGWLAVIKRVSSFRHFQRISFHSPFVSLPHFLISYEKGEKKVKVGKNSSRDEKWEFLEKRMELFLVMKMSWWEAREGEREKEEDERTKLKRGSGNM